ncbi:MAG: TonB-dependent receptor [Acidobacteriaceae bacterium]|nr:TonB-dependent receptor [Acidobacteriaceae bacterium]
MDSYFPAPNNPGVGFTGTNNYIRSDSNNIQKNTWTARLDHNFTENTRTFGRYSYDDSPYARASPYTFANPGSPGFGAQDFTRYNAVYEVDHIFSPTLISQFRLSFSRLANQRGPISQGFDMSQLGFPSNLQSQIGQPAAFPVIQITGYSPSASISNENGVYALGETGLLKVFANNYGLQGSISKNLRSHEIRTGGEFRVVQLNTLQTGDNSTNFMFTSAFTQGPNPSTSASTAGDPVASFLLGTPASGSVTPSPALALQTKYYAGFVQDNWKVTNRLTLNMGLRYEVETPRTDRYNQLSNFNPNAPVPLNAPGLNLHGALTFVGVNGNPRTDYNTQWDHVAPRFGFSWQVAPKTVIRAGAGLFYGTLWGISSSPANYGDNGFISTSTMVTSAANGFTPLNTLSNPYPNGLVPAAGSKLGSATSLGQSIDFFDRNNKTPYSEQWNFDVQRELPAHFLLDAGYMGTHNLHEPGNLILNQLNPQYLSLGNALRNTVANPFYGQIGVGTLAQPTISQAQLLVPYPQFTGVTSDNANWAGGRYNALQVKLQKRFSKDLDTLISYTWSKLMDQASGSFTGETLGGGAIQNYYNLNAEWSPSLVDQTHRLVFNVVYGLPFYRGQKGFLGQALGGWEISILGSFYSGSPLGITSAVNNTFSQGGGQRPNWNGVNPGLSDPTVTKWFDTSLFSAPAAYTFGNAPRTFNGARSDWTRNIDLSLHKSFKITERFLLQVRGEAFNLANTPIFAPPNTSFGSAAFGVVSSQANQPRVVQLAMKLLF